MKWLQKIMGLKDKVAAQEAKNKASAKKAVKKQPKVEEVVNVEVPKVRNTISGNTNLSKEEAAFIIAKLRQAEYKGSEFEQFYTIMTKLQKLL
jgi:hypothetical protein